MTQTIEATYEDGVFVPTQPLALANHDRVRLIVEPITPNQSEALATIRHRRNARLQIDEALAREIADAPDFDLLDVP